MRLPAAMILVFVLAGHVFGQEESRRAQVAAATSTAVGALREAIGQNGIGRNLTVHDLIERTNGTQQLTDILRRAEQIGGPRWVDETCQVRLDISGTRVAHTLVQIAAANPRKTPVPADVLAVRLRDWSGRTFSATGSSTGAAEIEHARPSGESDAWAAVTDEARRDAVAAARQDAVDKAIASIRPVTVPQGKTVDDLLRNDPGARERLQAWLAARPVTEVEFRDDLGVGVVLATPPAEFYEALREAATGSPNGGDEAAWLAVREEFIRRAGMSVGRASAAPNAAAPPRDAVQLPELPPSWTNDQIVVNGSAAFTGSKLQTARSAEADASQRLAAQVGNLQLAPGVTIAQAAQRDAHIREALTRAPTRARRYKVDYKSDGGVVVHVALNLRDLWEELAAGR